ncbi:MAG: DUF2927 domain-containing protein [Pseudomonadota bacterium]
MSTSRPFRHRAARAGARLSLLLGAALGLAACAVDTAELYRDYAAALTGAGRFRTDYAPPDAPFTKQDVERNLIKVAFEPEAQLQEFYRDSGPRRLSKWSDPISYRVVGDAVRPDDRDQIAEIAATLSRHSGLEITEVAFNAPARLTIFIFSPEGRAELTRRYSAQRWYRGSLLKDWAETPNPPCIAQFDAGHRDGGPITGGEIFLKGELEGAFRRACFEEEFAQTLGLFFDHDDVRPSIFNDDQEFIALTRHDAALIEVLYDPRLEAGMTRDEAAPIVRRIVAERPRTLTQ